MTEYLKMCLRFLYVHILVISIPSWVLTPKLDINLCESQNR